MTETEDMQLLREFAKRQSEAAFGELVRRHVNLVDSVALRQTGNRHAAEEITQAVFIILVRKAGSLGSKTILSGWLYQTARLTAANFLRTERRRSFREQEAYMQSLSNESEPEAWPQIAPLLDDVLGKLGEKDRHAIVLRFFEGKSLGEVGAALGASEDAAKMRVNRALEKLRKIFTKRGVTMTATLIAGAVSANSVQAAPVGLAVTVTAMAAKDAAVGGSTLTLVKGTLKLMAWTKAKSAVVVGAGVLLATGTATVLVKETSKHPPQPIRLKLPTGQQTPKVAFGFSHGIILAADGSLWAWGEEENGWPVLGLANVRNTTSLRRVGGESVWLDLAVGPSHNLALESDGTLWAWGENKYYQLGDGTKLTADVPVPSVSGNDWRQIAVGGGVSFALKKDGTLWAWGNNWAGQLGTGGTQHVTQATQVGSSTNWVKVWAGSLQTVGLQSDGSLWFWGSLTGEANANLLVPTRISPDTNWVDVCFGYYTVFAIKSDGTLWCWGRGAHFYTQAPDASLNAAPVRIGKENDWQSCMSAPGGFYHLLMKKDGSLWALDASEHRAVKTDSEYKPVKFLKIDLHKGIAAFAAGRDNIGVVLTRDGEVRTWGKVIGEHSPKDYSGPKGELLRLESKSINQPWQLPIVVPQNESLEILVVE